MEKRDYKKAQERLYFLVFCKEKQTAKEKKEINILKEQIKNYQDENLFQLNSGHYLEITDRLNCQNDIIENIILGHPVFTNSKYEKQRKEVIKAQQLINNCYQFFGEIADKKNTEIENIIEIIDEYLNAGDKQSRTKASIKAKEAYKKYYGIEYKNKTERAA